MTKSEFTHMLIQEAYPNPVEVHREPNGFLTEHSHPFEVYALILEGEIQLTVEGQGNTYRAGDIFYLGAQELHEESYGKAGVRYLASRRLVDDF
ncbi:cupin domain-containing protein [Polynucleobacter sp. Latsch14-2]|jgi:quercetin dioxygenase-like cupin family protein|uniref:cupin domain-containing protein n=1 Tax=Polynucleobacter sp. Latsch14-2 TaxID=2576920 RepID=UPI001C0AB0B7|nr:cupin domain-containing protein [Polynucleobacter sp. Latsch14-2]MBU3614914.1 cupin domain-containing protein [Polynucleobacter sp. Latsch14-2]